MRSAVTRPVLVGVRRGHVNAPVARAFSRGGPQEKARTGSSLLRSRRRHGARLGAILADGGAFDPGVAVTVFVPFVGGLWFLAVELSKLQSGGKALQASVETLGSQVQKLDAKLEVEVQKLGSQVQKLDEKLEAQVQKLDEKLEAQVQKLDAKLEAQGETLGAQMQKLDEKLGAQVQKLDEKLDALQATTSCLPRAFRSVATGLQEAADGIPVRALIAASPTECASWLAAAGFNQYVQALAPLGGATLLMQTPESLVQAGVAPHHVPALLEKIVAAAQAPPTKRASSVHDSPSTLS